MIFGIITILIFTLFVGYVESIILSNMGVNPILIILIGFLTGFLIPGRLFRWIYKEEIKELQTPKDEE